MASKNDLMKKYLVLFYYSSASGICPICSNHRDAKSIRATHVNNSSSPLFHYIVDKKVTNQMYGDASFVGYILLI